MALGGALSVSLYLIFGRETQHRGPGIGQYAATAYVVGALTLLPAPLLLGSGDSGWQGEVYPYGLLLAFIPSPTCRPLFSQLGHKVGQSDAGRTRHPR